MALDLKKLVRPAWGQLAIRFAFGAGIGLVAGIIGIRFGPRVCGVFLAFPAILPAALTLLERSEGSQETDIDALGAALGSLALVAFPIAIILALGPLGPLRAILLAAGVWTAVAIGAFLATRPLLGLLRRS